MGPPDDLVRLRHLRDTAEEALHFADGKGRQDLEGNELLRLATTKLVEIVGESAKQVSAATRIEHPEVPWSDAARMRARLVHYHFDIDLDILWVTITCRSCSTSCRHGSGPRDADLRALGTLILGDRCVAVSVASSGQRHIAATAAGDRNPGHGQEACTAARNPAVLEPGRVTRIQCV